MPEGRSDNFGANPAAHSEAAKRQWVLPTVAEYRPDTITQSQIAPTQGADLGTYS